MKRQYYLACWHLQFKLALKRLPSLLAMLLAVLGLGSIAALSASNLFGTSSITRTVIAAATDDADSSTEALISAFGRINLIGDYANIVMYPSADAARQAVHTHQAGAAFIVPAGYVKTLTAGQTPPPVELILDSSQPIESTIGNKMAESSVSIISHAWQGIAHTLRTAQHLDPGRTDWSDLTAAANNYYFQWINQANDMYNRTLVNTEKQLHLSHSITQHYLLCAVLFFLFLATAMLYPFFSLRAQSGWINRLRSAAGSLPIYAFTQLLAFMAVFIIPFGLLLAAVGVIGNTGDSPLYLQTIAAVLTSCLCLGLFGYVLCNAGSIVAAVGISFVFSFVSLLLAGGLIPAPLLPGLLSQCTWLSPFTWMKDALGAIYGQSTGAQTWINLALSVAVLGVCAYVLTRRMETHSRESEVDT